MTPVVSLNIPEGVMFTDCVKRIKNDRCFYEKDYISRWYFEECKRANKAI